MKILLDLTMLHTITLLTLVNYSASMMKALQLQYVRKSVKTKVHLVGLGFDQPLTNGLQPQIDNVAFISFAIHSLWSSLYT